MNIESPLWRRCYLHLRWYFYYYSPDECDLTLLVTFTCTDFYLLTFAWLGLKLRNKRSEIVITKMGEKTQPRKKIELKRMLEKKCMRMRRTRRRRRRHLSLPGSGRNDKPGSRFRF